MITTDSNAPGAGVYGALPLMFVPNVGQTDERVQYYAKGADHAIYFMPGMAAIAFARKGSASRDAPEAPGPVAQDGFALFLCFTGANPAVRLEGRRQGEGKAHYLIGSDPARWLTDLPMYGELLYRELWPGIDAVFQGERGWLKCTFAVQPGARPEQIRLAYQGARDLSLDDYGHLLIHTPDGALKGEKPAAFQEIGGQQVPVACDFVLEQDAGGDFYVSLEADTGYDRSHPLMVDIGLLCGALPGSSPLDASHGIALDAEGCAYVTGATLSLNVPATAGAFQMASAEGSLIFVTKLNASGTGLVYATYLGGSGDDTATGIAVDEATGHAYVTGTTSSADFPVTSGAVQTEPGGGFDAFVTKLNPDGNALEYSTYLGGKGLDIAHAITVAAGSALVTGSTDSADFPVTMGVVQPGKAGDGDAFVARLNANGTALEFATYLGGPRASGGIAAFSAGFGIATDAAGCVYVGGMTTSPHFPVTPGAFQTTCGSGDGASDGFVTKLSASGGALMYSTYLGGKMSDSVHALAIGADGSVLVTGSTASVDFPVTPGAHQTALGGATDAFVTQLNPSGSALVYSTYLGGSEADAGRALRIGSEGHVYVAGETASADYPVTPGAAQTVPGGNGDAFLTVLHAAGNALLYSTWLGGSGPDAADGLAIDAAGNAYLTGSFSFADGAFPSAPADRAIAAKIEPALTPPSAPMALALQPSPPSPVTIDPAPPVMTGPLVLPPAARPGARNRKPRRQRGRKGVRRLHPKARGMRSRPVRQRSKRILRSHSLANPGAVRHIRPNPGTVYRGRPSSGTVYRGRPSSGAVYHGRPSPGAALQRHASSGTTRPGPSKRHFLEYWKREITKFMQSQLSPAGAGAKRGLKR